MDSGGVDAYRDCFRGYEPVARRQGPSRWWLRPVPVPSVRAEFCSNLQSEHQLVAFNWEHVRCEGICNGNHTDRWPSPRSGRLQPVTWDAVERRNIQPDYWGM